MTDFAQIADSARSAAALLVDREVRKHGSRMAAYEAVSAMVGVSSSWLRRFLARSPDVTLSVPAILNIRAQYGRMCLRLEAEIANERALVAALKDDVDAAVEALEGTSAPPKGTPPAATEDTP